MFVGVFVSVFCCPDVKGCLVDVDDSLRLVLFCGDFFCGAACATTCRGDCRDGDDTAECLIAKALAHMSQPVETRRQNCTETLCISSREEEEEEEEKRLLRVCVCVSHMCVCVSYVCV